MSEALKIISEQLNEYYGDKFFLIIAIFACIYLYVCDAGFKNKVIYPCFLIIFIIVNPLLYKFVFYRVVYWRLFWMFPNAMIIAAASAKILQKCSKIHKKIISFCVIVSMLIVCGNNVYKNAEFSKTTAVEKISAETVEICDIMLNRKTNPKCIVPIGISTEVRQYSGEIQMLYGRNANGYITDISDELYLTYACFEGITPDYAFVFSQAEEKKCDFVVSPQSVMIDVDIVSEYGYELLTEVNGYKIYYNTGF